jgi:ribosomal protein S18 acetylase RimI-like enzyme
MDILVRPATEAEYASAGDVCVAAYRDDGQLPLAAGFDYGAVLADVAGRALHGEVLVAVDAGSDSVVGCVTFIEPGTRYAEMAQPGEAEFRMLAVAPTAQGRGIGAALVQACLDRAVELGYRAVAICTRDINETALRMYGKFGFRRIPERDWSPQPGISLSALRLQFAEPAA